MLGVRSLEAGLGEPEQDANTALTELDKGLRASKIGDQCEAIVRFPKLFEKYPFPILVNSSLLKLAEVFRVGNNILRLWILKVCEQTDKHLDKIINIEEFVRRIFIVYSSNDPVARGLSLRTLGAVARIIPEKEQVHHGIRQSLDSHDSVEVDAAIAAAMQFAAQSKIFAVSMCGKMTDMIEGLATPDKRKLQLIPILRYMHHDANTAALVRSLCLNLLSKYPAEEFVTVTLDSLTQLSISTLIDVPAQVSLLLQYLKDPRGRVRAKTLQCLKDVAVRGAVKWPSEAVELIIKAGNNHKINGDEKSVTLGILLELSRSSVGCQIKVTDAAPLQMLLVDAMVYPNQNTACSALEVVTSVLSHCYKKNEPLPSLLEHTVQLHLESQLVTATSYEILVRILKCAVQLSTLSTVYSSQLTKFMFGVLTQKPSYTVAQCLLVCEALAAIGANSQHSPLIDYQPHIIKKLTEITVMNKLPQKQTRLSESLFILILQLNLGKQISESSIREMDKSLQKLDLWSHYKIARCAARYGHHVLCHPLWKLLSEKVCSEHLYFWFLSLYETSVAETILQGSAAEPTFSSLVKDSDIPFKSKLQDRISQAIVHYNKAVTAMKSASSTSLPLSFQIEYLRLRLEILQSLLQLTLSCDLLLTPPAAIAGAVAQNNKDEMLRFGQVVVELRKCVTQLRNCEEMYGKLYQISFDADNATLDLLKILQFMCNVMTISVDRICSNSNVEKCFELYNENASTPEARYLLYQCENVLKISNDVNERKPITPLHTGSILTQIALIAGTPLCIPRFFFQVLQGTSVKLAISPVPKEQGQPIVHLFNTHLIIKVEGVIQHVGRTIPFRKVSEIHITVTPVLQTRQVNTELNKVNENAQILSQTVKPNRDYFSGSFLLTLSISGLWLVTIDANIIDDDGQTWKNGTRSSITIKVLDEPGKSTTNNRR